MSSQSGLPPARFRSRLTVFWFDTIFALTGTFWLFVGVVGLPAFAAMGRYEPDQEAAYLEALPFAFAICLVLTIASQLILKASAGQWFAGLRLEPVTQTGASKGVVGQIVFGGILFPALLLLPGPMLGFAIGPASALGSLALLIAGIGLIGFLCLKTDADGQTLIERQTGIRLVYKNPHQGEAD